MDHAEARERLADALLAPRDGGLEAALADPSATSVDLRAHLAARAPGPPAAAPPPPRPRRRLLPLVAAMAAVVVLVAGLAGGLALVDQRQEADRQGGEPGEVMAAAPAILAHPGVPAHRSRAPGRQRQRPHRILQRPARGFLEPPARPAGGSALRVLHRARRRPHVDRLDALERRPRLLVGPGLGDRLALATRGPLPPH